MAQLKDKKQLANKAKNVKKTKLTNKAIDKTKKEISPGKESIPAVVNLGGKAKEISKKGLSDLNYSDYYKDYLANKKDHKPDKKKIASLFKKASKPKNLGFTKIQEPKESRVFNATTPISYTKEVASNGYGKYFIKPGNQTVKAIPTVAVNLPAPISQTQQLGDQNFQQQQQQQQYSNPYPSANNFNQIPALPVKYNQFNNPRNNFYSNQDPSFNNYTNQNFNQLHPGFASNNNPRFNPNYQGFNNNYPNNYFSRPVNPFNQNPIDNVSTEQLFNFNLLDSGLPGQNNVNNNSNPNAIALANQRPDVAVLNQVTKLLDIMQRQMMTQQIILEKQQNQIEHQQDVIERLQTKLIEGQNQISREQDFGYSDSADIEPTDFLETQEQQFNDLNLNQKYYELDKTKNIAKNDRYDHFVDLSATNKIDNKKPKAKDTVHITDTLEYETDEIGSGEIAESDLIEYTDFDDNEDLIDPNLSEDDYEAKKLNDEEEFIKTSADGQISSDEENLPEEDNDDEDDEYTDLVSEEIDNNLSKKDDQNLGNEELIKTSELEEFDEDLDDDYTDLVTEEHLSTSDLSETSKTKSDLIATSIIENLEEDDNKVTETTKKKDLNLSETKLSPTKRFWEPLVGNPQYGFYNKKSWNWLGYFDRLKKWIPYNDSNQAPENPTFHNSLITKKAGNFNFWKKLIDNLDYGHRENGNWIWDGVFDQNFNWIPDPTIIKGTDLSSNKLEKIDLSVDNDLYEKYIGNEYYGYYDDDKKWVWTGKFSTDGTFIPDKVELVAPTSDLTEAQSIKSDLNKTVGQQKEQQDTSEVRKERKRLKQERKRLEKLQAKITSEIVEKKNEIETKDGFEKIPGETIEEICSASAPDLNLDLSEEPAVINTKKTKKSEPHFWEAFLGNSDYGHYNSDHQWVWDGYFDDERNWVADGAAASQDKQLDQKLTSTKIEKTSKKEQEQSVVVSSSEDLVKKPTEESKVLETPNFKIEVATQETNNLNVDVPIQNEENSKPLSDTSKQILISSPQTTEGIILDQKVEKPESEPIKPKTFDQVTPVEKQKDVYLPTVITQQNAEIAEAIKHVSEGNQKVLKILDQTNATSINNAALQSESKLPPTLPKVAIQDSEEIILDHHDDASDLSVDHDNKISQVAFVETTEIPISSNVQSDLVSDFKIASSQKNQIDKSAEYKTDSTPNLTANETEKPAIPSESENNVKQIVAQTSEESQTTNKEFKADDQVKEELSVDKKPEEVASESDVTEESLQPNTDLELESQSFTVPGAKPQSDVVEQPIQESPSQTLSEPLVAKTEEVQEETKVDDQVKEESNLQKSEEALADNKPEEVISESGVAEETLPPAFDSDLQNQSFTVPGATPQSDVVEQPIQESPSKTPSEPLVAKAEEVQEETKVDDQFKEESNLQQSEEALADKKPEEVISESSAAEETLPPAFDSGLQNQSFTAAAATPQPDLVEQPIQESPSETPSEPLVAKAEEVQEETKAEGQVKEEASLQQPEEVSATDAAQEIQQEVSSEEPAAEYWEQFVGNKDYGKYDADGNWEWSGYFDDDNNWVSTEPASEETLPPAFDSGLQNQSLTAAAATPQPDVVEQPIQESPSETPSEPLVAEAEEVQEETKAEDQVKEEASLQQPEEVSATDAAQEVSSEEPAAEYWEQFVGNKDYGKYDADGNWEWSGYFDDDNNWVSTEPASEETLLPAFDSDLQNQSLTAAAATPQPDVVEQPIQESPSETPFEPLVAKVEEVQEETKAEDQVKEEASLQQPEEVSATDAAQEIQQDVSSEEPAAEYWEQFVGNKDYGKYDADGNWEWSGYFDDDNNWVSTEPASEETLPPAFDSDLQNQSLTAATATPQPDVVEQPIQESPSETPSEPLVAKAEEVQEETKAEDQVKEEASLQQPEEPAADKKPEEVSAAKPGLESSTESAAPKEVSPKAEEPAAEYWEQFVGNKDYGAYDKDGNWEWSGYFDDDNNWIPNDQEDDNTEIVEAVEGTNFISADDEGKIDFDKYVGNENFGYYDENNEWEWYEGDFDEDGNWMVYEQGEPDKNFDITEDIPIFKNIDTDSVDADEWLSQFNEDDADTIFGGK